MHFAFSDDQLLLRDGLRDVLDKECTPENVRDTWESPDGVSRDRWRQLADLGIVGLTVPEEYGGFGMDDIDLVLLLEEAGRAALPEPLIETTAVAAPLIADIAATTGGHANEDGEAPRAAAVADEWLPQVATGDALLAFAPEVDRFVSGAAPADLLLLQSGDELHALEPPDVSLTAQEPVDPGRALHTVDWTPSPGTRIASGDTTSRAMVRAADRGAIGAAAQMVGAARRVIDLATSYATKREQFGRPIGSFQAVKHLLADAAVRVEFAAPAVYRAAMSVAEDSPDRVRDVSAAKLLASRAASRACRAGLQVHGAIGYTWEHDLHVYMKRVWGLVPAWGDESDHRDRLAEAIIDR